MARSPRTYTPKKAGEVLGVSADTIRRYCQLYRRHLSPGATPEAGRARLLNDVDLHILGVAKRATEAGESIESIDDMLATIAIPEDVVGDDDQVETLPAPVEGVGVSESAVALLRQMTTTLDRLEARDRRFDQLEAEVAALKRVIETTQSAPIPVAPSRPAWATYAPFVLAVAGVILAILVIALIVALLR